MVPTKRHFSRRRFLGGGAAVAGLVSSSLVLSASPQVTHAAENSPVPSAVAPAAGGDDSQVTVPQLGPETKILPFMAGDVDSQTNGFDPTQMLTLFNNGNNNSTIGNQTRREYTLTATNKTIFVAPGQKFAALAYNGQVPGPTLRATEGDHLRITLINKSDTPHVLHFSGVHPQNQQNGIDITLQPVAANGGQAVYEFDAPHFGVYLYQGYAVPMASHAYKGLYGMLIIDPKSGSSADSSLNRQPDGVTELFMVLNGFLLPDGGQKDGSSGPSANDNNPALVSNADNSPFQLIENAGDRNNPGRGQNRPGKVPNRKPKPKPTAASQPSPSANPKPPAAKANPSPPANIKPPAAKANPSPSANIKPPAAKANPSPPANIKPPAAKANPSPTPANKQPPPADNQGSGSNTQDSNDLYAVNTVAYHYVKHPIPVKQSQLVRIYLANLTEFDRINSFHLHGSMFKIYRSGTSLQPDGLASTVMLSRGETAILEFSFPSPGQFLFHAYQGEFADLGWMGLFNVQ